MIFSLKKMQINCGYDWHDIETVLLLVDKYLKPVPSTLYSSFYP